MDKFDTKFANFGPGIAALARSQAIDCAAKKLNATPAPGAIPGLWNAPGYPELTTGQLLDAAARR